MSHFYHRVATGWGLPFLGSIDTSCEAGSPCNTEYVCKWRDDKTGIEYNTVQRVPGTNQCASNPGTASSGQCLVWASDKRVLQVVDPINGICPSSDGSTAATPVASPTCSSCGFYPDSGGSADCSLIMANQSLAEQRFPGSVAYCQTNCGC
jgi:hypothetical protein